ncbi:Putative glycosyltransferase EpsD [Stieleria maiorica]|uniref:Glycosyltransferase EpsD n=1 Tax=Stieleria maiorica TaxID=2795974 RepID=A0A5B9MFD9_9BACT|nr:glycosyltransferase family 4 protein [Stieleria maiorica]QEF98720.1 Putative glycosyltransferase EpsD [Stieleria maiorica]
MNRRVKVLHIHVMSVISGSGINTYLSMEGMDPTEFEIEFACAPGGKLGELAERAGIPFHPVDHFVQPISPYHDLRALIELIKIIRRGKYDLVHTHNSKGGILGRLAAWICRTPIIIHTIHGFAFHSSETPWRRKLFIHLERWAAKVTDRLIVISQPLQDWGLRVGIGHEDQYTKIYSGIEIDKFKCDCDQTDLRKSLGLRQDDLVIGLVAKLWDGKGHAVAINALSKLVRSYPSAKLVIVGEGYLRDELETQTSDLKLQDHVVFTGFRSDIPNLNAMFDIAILASDFEGMGRVLLEAMVMGRPVVASDVGGIPDVVDDGTTGILVPPGNIDELAGALATLLADPTLREKMGRAAYARITQKFSSETMVRQIRDVYLETANSKRAGHRPGEAW